MNKQVQIINESPNGEFDDIIGIGMTKEEIEELKADSFFSSPEETIIPDFSYSIGDGYRSNTLDSVVAEFHRREELGLKKYGASIDRSDLKLSEWLQHLKEELMDATLYVQRALDLVVLSGDLNEHSNPL
jgi:hypothetical protein